MRRKISCAVAVLVAVLLHPTASLARTIVVGPGASIQQAVAQALPGDVVRVLPGIYHEGSPGDLDAITVTTDHVSLVGVSRPGQPVVLENAGGQSYGIWVSPADSVVGQADAEHPPCATAGRRLRHFTLSGFTVRGFPVHGIHLACVDGFTISGNISDHNDVYGIFPIFSTNGVVSGNQVADTGSDAGIYVGQSDRVLISRNDVRDSLLGIEVQDSIRCAVVQNQVHGNTLGILVDVAGGTIVTVQRSTVVVSNLVQDNNRPNTAEPGDIIGVLPPGIGILAVGGRDTVVAHNRVLGNQFGGIGVVSLCLGLALQGQSCSGLDANPLPVDVTVVKNRLTGNGLVPSGNPALDGLRGDLIWDGSGGGNCWSANAFRTAVPPRLPPCG